MKEFRLLALLGPLSFFPGATPAVASGLDWSTGQALAVKPWGRGRAVLSLSRTGAPVSAVD